MVSGYLGLAGLASLTHVPFDRIAPLVISVILSAGFSFMLMVFAGSMQTAVAQPAAPATGPPADEGAIRARLTALAAWGAVKKLDEFHADQFAAHSQGTARPLT